MVANSDTEEIFGFAAIKQKLINECYNSFDC